ncbi:SDR family oxidoreductase [Paenibacillus sp. FSL R5-0527]|uniref:SDR family oxidoreductase n=1 Tax=Paenibacillus sp. FSL R5-0527 TaxID=2975321 RepID=UPI00097A0D6D|nr:3-beta hydroxysteroid dehydrogenase [Paenibacillus macerans]
MRVFVTGATGFIGSAVVKELISAGHEVVGLARSESSAKGLIAAGAKAHIGSIEDVESLREGAKGANAAIHLAFYHKFSHASFSARLRILFGGSPSGIMSRFLAAAVETERRAIEALGSSLTGEDRALVVISPTTSLALGRIGKESDMPDPTAPGWGRSASENTALSFTSHGIRASVVRLPPCVHDHTMQGFVSIIISIAQKKGVSSYIGEGSNRWGAVHRLDAAHLIRLAMERGPGGARYHGVGEEGIPLRDIASTIGRHLKMPVQSISAKKAVKHFSWLSTFVSADNPVSSKWTQEQLGWQPKHPGLISDLDRAEYRNVR